MPRTPTCRRSSGHPHIFRVEHDDDDQGSVIVRYDKWKRPASVVIFPDSAALVEEWTDRLTTAEKESRAEVPPGAMTPAEFRGIRELTGHGIEDLATTLLVSRSIILKWEKGDRAISETVAAEMRDLAAAYQADLAEALDYPKPIIHLPKDDTESWVLTERPIRWWRQIAAHAHLAHGTRVVPKV